MSFKNGTKIIFESKYKGNIEKKDVDKFYRDMEGFDDGIIGGVFVSFLCKNIPNKGSINFEVTAENKKPLMYVAYENEDEFNQYFPHHIVMFSKLCDSYNESKSSDVNISDVIEEVRFISDIVNKNKRRLDDFRGKFQKYYTEVEEDNKVLMVKIDNIVKRVPKATNKKVFICNQCTYTCASKRTLDKHVLEKHS
jgi:rubrerythrin